MSKVVVTPNIAVAQRKTNKNQGHLKFRKHFFATTMPTIFDESILRYIDPSQYVKGLLKKNLRSDGRTPDKVRVPVIKTGWKILISTTVIID